MGVHDILKEIREKADISQRTLADFMGLTSSYVSKVERGLSPPTAKYLNSFREVMRIPGAPITEEERVAFRERLYQWRDDIRHRQVDAAEKVQPELQKAAYGCCTAEIEILYDLFSIGYYGMLGNHVRANEVLNALEAREEEFNNEHKCCYCFQKGIACYTQKRFAEAADYFLATEKADERQSEVNLESLYYNVALCYTDIDCPVLAIQYIEKGKALNPRTHDVHYDELLAINLKKFGRFEDAIVLLKDCLQRDRVRQGNLSSPNNIRHNMGCVYHLMGDTRNALIEFEYVSNHANVADSLYITNLLFWATALRDAGNAKLATEKVKEGLVLSSQCEPEHTLFTILDLELNGDNDKTRGYIETKAILTLFDAGRYIDAAKYCERLLTALSKRGTLKKALKLANMAIQCHKIIEGEHP